MTRNKTSSPLRKEGERGTTIHKETPSTFRVSHTGEVRLSADLVAAGRVTVTFDKEKLTLTLRPATEEEKGSVPLKYYRRRIPIINFRRKLKEFGSTPYAAKGIYRAKRIKDVVIVDMRQKVVRKHGTLEPRKSQRWSSPYRRNSALGVAFAKCRRGTTISEIEKVAEELDVNASWLLYYLQSKGSNGCECVRDGEKIRVFTPAEWRRRQQRRR